MLLVISDKLFQINEMESTLNIKEMFIQTKEVKKKKKKKKRIGGIEECSPKTCNNGMCSMVKERFSM